MKRELKGEREMSSRKIIPVTEHVPMKRELKVMYPYLKRMPLFSYRACPDEEGTERLEYQ